MADINLPADLPENWSAGQTIAPTGEEAGLTKQHGYNYLMKQVNAAQRACNTLGGQAQDLSEKMLRYLAERYTKTEIDALLAGKAASNHSHSSATTGAAGFLSTADKAKLDKCPDDTNTALANKAKTLLGVFTADGTNDFVKWIDNFDKSGGIRVNKGTKTALNLPSIGEYWEGWLHYVNPINKVITLYEIRGYAAYYAALTDDIFFGWKQLATTEPPQEYDLPLASGISVYRPCTYFKNQFNEVIINLSVSGSNIVAYQTLAILPAGFRPKALIELGCIVFGLSSFSPAVANVYPDGRITVSHASNGVTHAHVPTITFLAVQ